MSIRQLVLVDCAQWGRARAQPEGIAQMVESAMALDSSYILVCQSLHRSDEADGLRVLLVTVMACADVGAENNISSRSYS